MIEIILHINILKYIFLVKHFLFLLKYFFFNYEIETKDTSKKYYLVDFIYRLNFEFMYL
jgi:hypothetical protein